MIGESVVWIAVLAGIAAAICVAFVPGARRYAIKYWWVCVLAAGFIAYYVLRTLLDGRRRPSALDDAKSGGRSKASLAARSLLELIDSVDERMVSADADLVRSRLTATADLEKFDTELNIVRQMGDSTERRKALIRLVEDHR